MDIEKTIKDIEAQIALNEKLMENLKQETAKLKRAKSALEK